MDGKERAGKDKELKARSPYPRNMSRTSDFRSSHLLPPIGFEDAGCSSQQTPMQQSARDKPWSRFHAGCHNRHSLYLDWTAVKTEKKAPSVSSIGKPPRREAATSTDSIKDLQEQEIVEYLEANKGFLDRYIIQKIPVEVIEIWMLNKIRQEQMPSRGPSNSGMVNCRQQDKISKKDDFIGLLQVLQDDPTELTVMWELADYMVSSVGVDAHRVYKLYPDHPSFVQYFVSNELSQNDPPVILVRAQPEQVKLVLEVAKSGSCRRLTRGMGDGRFPETPRARPKSSVDNVAKAEHLMYQPILAKSGKTAYVIEMWRIQDRFRDIDEKVSSNFIVLGSLALHYCNLYLDKNRERNMSDFLLDVVKAIFEEMVSLDQLIKRILEFAQRLVNADRASLFLVDYRNFELVSTVFDLKFEPGQERDMEKKEIRMPIHRGIAGHVAMSGEAMNIPDAYSDYRFNREVDEATGYKTVNILCMPIKVEGSVIGVVQMVNKRDDDNFCHEDEVAFEIFSTFFGLALHNARLYDRIMRKEQKYRVALEVLSYHNTCREVDVIAMLSDRTRLAVDLDDYYLDPFELDEAQKCKSVIYMFDSLFDLSKFDLSTLTRFILTVKKNYRTVPYHNFDHGWSVAHSMYVMLKNDYQRRFNYKMRLAMFVASLCHDLDHRGYTNKYMSESASPLAAMYTTSTLEHHHFNITVTILQQDGHNIFSHVTSEEYKEILGYMRHCILATDLAKFFPNLEKLNQLHVRNNPQFNWHLNTHRELGMALSMTAADLSASAKPWDIQIKTVKVIFEEFYDQGDKERAAGREPIPMMDRNKPDEQPASQVGFLSQICIPCYRMLYQILPNTKPMYIMATQNLDRWKARADKIQRNLDKASKPDGKKKRHVPGINKEVILKAEMKEDGAFSSDAKLEAVTWEEEHELPQNVMTRSGIWTKIDSETWIDEDGVVLCKQALMSLLRKEKNENNTE